MRPTMNSYLGRKWTIPEPVTRTKAPRNGSGVGKSTASNPREVREDARYAKLVTNRGTHQQRPEIKQLREALRTLKIAFKKLGPNAALALGCRRSVTECSEIIKAIRDTHPGGGIGDPSR